MYVPGGYRSVRVNDNHSQTTAAPTKRVTTKRREVRSRICKIHTMKKILAIMGRHELLILRSCGSDVVKFCERILTTRLRKQRRIVWFSRATNLRHVEDVRDMRLITVCNLKQAWKACEYFKKHFNINGWPLYTATPGCPFGRDTDKQWHFPLQSNPDTRHRDESLHSYSTSSTARNE